MNEEEAQAEATKICGEFRTVRWLSQLTRLPVQETAEKVEAIQVSHISVLWFGDHDR